MTRHLCKRTSWLRAAATAGWYTLHIFIGCWLLRFVLGSFTNGDRVHGQFLPESMSGVLAYLSVFQTPAAAFFALFLALALGVHLMTIMWQRLVMSLEFNDLRDLSWDGWLWSFKMQFFSHWLAITLGLLGLTFLATNQAKTHGILGITAFCEFLLPLLVLRPRWLSDKFNDTGAFPSLAATGAYLLLTCLSVALSALFDTFNNPLTWVADIGIAAALSLLSMSILIHVQHRTEILPHIRSRFHLRFWLLIIQASLLPLQVLMRWWLPPILLIAFHAIFVSPALRDLAPHLPALLTPVHDSLLVAVAWLPQHWWAFALPMLTVWWCLYFGRCIVLFDTRATHFTQS